MNNNIMQYNIEEYTSNIRDIKNRTNKNIFYFLLNFKIFEKCITYINILFTCIREKF